MAGRHWQAGARQEGARGGLVRVAVNDFCWRPFGLALSRRVAVLPCCRVCVRVFAPRQWWRTSSWARGNARYEVSCWLGGALVCEGMQEPKDDDVLPDPPRSDNPGQAASFPVPDDDGGGSSSRKHNT